MAEKKLTRKEAYAIKELLETTKLSFTEIGKRFGTSKVNISYIAKGRIWRELNVKRYSRVPNYIPEKELTEDQLNNIKFFLEATELTYQQIADELGVPLKKIHKIVSSKKYKWLEIVRFSKLPKEKKRIIKIADLETIGYAGFELHLFEDGFSKIYDKKGFYKKGTKNKAGYITVNLKKKTAYLHRVIGLSFIENNDPENKTFINHKDGVKWNCHISNLEWATRSENIQHAIETGLMKTNYRAVLTESDVFKIKDLLETTTLSYSKIADGFNCSPQAITAIAKNRTWKHLNLNIIRYSKVSEGAEQ